MKEWIILCHPRLFSCKGCLLWFHSFLHFGWSWLWYVGLSREWEIPLPFLSWSQSQQQHKHSLSHQRDIWGRNFPDRHFNSRLRGREVQIHSLQWISKTAPGKADGPLPQFGWVILEQSRVAPKLFPWGHFLFVIHREVSPQAVVKAHRTERPQKEKMKPERASPQSSHVISHSSHSVLANKETV